MTAIRRRHVRRSVVLLALALALAACGSPDPAPSAARAATSTSTATATATETSTTTSSVVATTTTTAADPPAVATTVTTPHPAELDRVGDAGQAVVVTAAAYGATTATVTTWQRAGGEWEPVHGPWPAWVGRAGMAPPGEKREGDGRTPSGTYGFDFAFGVQPDPGVALPYRRVTGPSIVWDDVPSSPSYNLWVDGGRGEPMFVSPAYDYGVAIAYNPARTPGLGSAIFLHVSIGVATAGCVSLPADELLPILRWLDPARAPAIVMEVA